MIVVDDFTRFTWAVLLRSKFEAPHQTETLCKRLQNEKGVSVNRLPSDHGREFENSRLQQFCTKVGIAQDFSAPITPKKNGVVESKNRVIHEMARTIMHNKDVDKNLLGETVNTACHIVNRVYFKPRTKKTPYELQKGRKPNVKHFRIFGNTCFILRDRENVGKFDTRNDEGIFLGYSSSSKAYRVFNKRTSKVMETVNVVIDKTSTTTTQKEVDQ